MRRGTRCRRDRWADALLTLQETCDEHNATALRLGVDDEVHWMDIATAAVAAATEQFKDGRFKGTTPRRPDGQHL